MRAGSFIVPGSVVRCVTIEMAPVDRGLADASQSINVNFAERRIQVFIKYASILAMVALMLGGAISFFVINPLVGMLFFGKGLVG